MRTKEKELQFIGKLRKIFKDHSINEETSYPLGIDIILLISEQRKEAVDDAIAEGMEQIKKLVKDNPKDFPEDTITFNPRNN